MKNVVISVSTGKLIDVYDNAEKLFFSQCIFHRIWKKKTFLLEKSCYACTIVVEIFI